MKFRFHNQLEMEADLLGQTLTLAFADEAGYRLDLALWVIDYYFACIGFWERFLYDVVVPVAGILNTVASRQGYEVVMPTSLSPPGTHPPPATRRAALKLAMIDMLQGTPADGRQIGIAYDMAARTDPFIGALWKDAKPRFTASLERALQRVAAPETWPVRLSGTEK